VIADVPAPKTMPAQRIMIAARIKTFFILFASLDKSGIVCYYKYMVLLFCISVAGLFSPFFWLAAMVIFGILIYWLVEFIRL
jgi:hypothetical protein